VSQFLSVVILGRLTRDSRDGPLAWDRHAAIYTTSGDAPLPGCGRIQCPMQAHPPQRAGAARALLSACLARCPRRLAALRASGNSAPAARDGAARSTLGTRRRPRPAPWLSGRLSSRVTTSLPFVAGRAANWALHGRTLSSRRGIYIFDRWAVESVSTAVTFPAAGSSLCMWAGRCWRPGSTWKESRYDNRGHWSHRQCGPPAGH
jgi:hypothetical protein